MAEPVSNFTPKQAVLLDTPTGYDKTGGFVTSSFASHCVSMAPPITSSSIIHDNACGTGQVAFAILAICQPSGFKIHATDISPSYLAACQETVSAHSWPIVTALMPSENLDFPNDHFTHAFNNFAIFMTPNGGLDAARETYRTLKPGGVAVLTCWSSITWLAPTRAVHLATRPDAPFPTPLHNWSDGSHLCSILKDAGFNSNDVTLTQKEVFVEVGDVKEWAETAWAILGGKPCGGWREGDAEKWDEAVALLVEKLGTAQGASWTEQGKLRMGCVGNVVVARK